MRIFNGFMNVKALAYAILQDTEPKPTAAHTTTGE